MLETLDQQATPSPSILLVEDDPRILRLLCQILQHNGFAVNRADSAEEALKQFSQHRESIELLIADVVLAGASGVRLMATIRQQKPRIRCCLMTGGSLEDTEVYLQNQKPDHLFLKPFTIKDFLAVVSGLLRPVTVPGK